MTSLLLSPRPIDIEFSDLASEGSLPIPNLNVLVGHDASAPRLRCLQGALTKLISRARFDAFMGALNVLVDVGQPPGESKP